MNEPRRRAVILVAGASLMALMNSAAVTRAAAAACTEAFCWFGPAVTRVSASGAEPGLSAQAQTGPASADLVILNAIIYTGDAAKPRVEALAVEGERIVAAGTSREIRARVGPKTKVVDLKGRFAMPGFNDAHIHLASGGLAKLAVELGGSKSLAAFQQRIRERVKDYRPGDWVVGRGWDHTLWPEKRFPTRQDLDAVSVDHPMFFTRVDGHVSVANSKALSLAAITNATPNPSGGEIERDAATGEATGMLKETAASLVSRKIPPPDKEQRRRGILLALADAARFGITSIQDNSGWDDFLIYEQLKGEGLLTVRITEWLPFQASLARLEEMRKRGGTSDPWLKTGALKGVTDGTLGSRTAAMLAPFADDASTSGILRIPEADIRQMTVERDKAGFQIALHAIGDKANRVSLDAFAEARAANGTRDSRHRIEHAQVIAPEDFSRFAELGVIASMQPVHQSSDMRWAVDRVGPERAHGAYAWNTFGKRGVRLAFGTDFSVEPMNPMLGLYACVTRELPGGGPPGGWFPDEKIPLDVCIAAYTQGSAYAEFEEKNKGKLAPGMFADLVVLSADITQVAAAQLPKTEVLMTFVGGKLVYEKKP